MGKVWAAPPSKVRRTVLPAASARSGKMALTLRAMRVDPVKSASVGTRRTKDWTEVGRIVSDAAPVRGVWFRHLPAGGEPLHRPERPGDGRW